ncbi:MAG: hypothetical protein RLZZ528_1849 [Pseudomonadota bacterium]
MRLICPNCDAQYEVDESVIPEAGRDVQCSNCGHSWFQPGRFAAAQGTSADEVAAPEPPATEETDDDYDLIRALSEDPEIVAAARPAEPVPTLPSMAERRQPDPSVLNVLREEAEREARARRAEGIPAPLETQTELGLGPDPGPLAGPVAGSAALAAMEGARRPAAQAEPAPELVADLRASPEDAPDHKGQRKGLLPDIEEINSTLSAASGRAADFPDVIAAEAARQRRGGFRFGFSFAFLAAALLLGTYAMAPAIAERVPGAARPLAAYVARVDALRLWIDEKMRSSTEALRGDASQNG